MAVHILAIESSCDDTSAAVLTDGRVISNITATQKVHEQYGGVVPEVASRAHIQHIVPVVDQALHQAGIDTQALSAIAFTRGPGLVGSLHVGVSFCKGLALSLGIPLIEVNHMQAHVLAHMIGEINPPFPFLCLTVSGGHTQIVKVEDPFTFEVLGSTIDDAAGEAFDKAGKMLGLPYPAGPHIDKLAREGQPKFSFTKPKVSALDFSFSGLKTNILYFLQREVKQNPLFIEENLSDLCASIQQTIVDILMDKLVQASQSTGIIDVAIAGGVSANSALRQRLKTVGQDRHWKTYIPAFEYCTDNAGMIAMTAWYHYLDQRFVGHEVAATPRMDM